MNHAERLQACAEAAFETYRKEVPVLMEWEDLAYQSQLFWRSLALAVIDAWLDGGKEVGS